VPKGHSSFVHFGDGRACHAARLGDVGRLHGVPWTRHGTVRVYVVTMAPEVAGRIVDFPVADNQFVHKGDLLMVIDPRDYRIAVSRAEAG
jgi:multidrug resistance efflux pump